MAKAATADSVNQAEEGPDYKGALAIIRGPIAANKKESSAIGQQVGQDWKRIEKTMGLNRAGAQIFARIDAMAADTRTDALRTLMGLLGVAGFDDFNDLVDRAQASGSAKPPAAPKAPAAPAPVAAAATPPPADDSDFVAAAGDEPRFHISSMDGDVRVFMSTEHEGDDVLWFEGTEKAGSWTREEAEKLMAEGDRLVPVSPDLDPASAGQQAAAAGYGAPEPEPEAAPAPKSGRKAGKLGLKDALKESRTHLKVVEN